MSLYQKLFENTKKILDAKINEGVSTDSIVKHNDESYVVIGIVPGKSFTLKMVDDELNDDPDAETVTLDYAEGMKLKEIGHIDRDNNEAVYEGKEDFIDLDAALAGDADGTKGHEGKESKAKEKAEHEGKGKGKEPKDEFPIDKPKGEPKGLEDIKPLKDDKPVDKPKDEPKGDAAEKVEVDPKKVEVIFSTVLGKYISKFAEEVKVGKFTGSIESPSWEATGKYKDADVKGISYKKGSGFVFVGADDKETVLEGKLPRINKDDVPGQMKAMLEGNEDGFNAIFKLYPELDQMKAQEVYSKVTKEFDKNSETIKKIFDEVKAKADELAGAEADAKLNAFANGVALNSLKKILEGDLVEGKLPGINKDDISGQMISMLESDDSKFYETFAKKFGDKEAKKLREWMATRVGSTADDVELTASTANEAVDAPADQYEVIARGITSEDVAKKVATDKNGVVIKDDSDKEGKKFAVQVKK